MRNHGGAANGNFQLRNHIPRNSLPKLRLHVRRAMDYEQRWWSAKLLVQGVLDDLATSDCVPPDQRYDFGKLVGACFPPNERLNAMNPPGETHSQYCLSKMLPAFALC